MKPTIILIVAAMMAMPLTTAVAAEYSSENTELAPEKKPKKKKGEVKEVTFNVHLHCEDCVAKVFDNLSRTRGVKDLDISLEKQTVFIKYDDSRTSETVLKETIEKLGYPVGDTHEHHHDHTH